MSEDFDTILDRCIADVKSGRETVDSCVRRYPAQAGRLAAILPLIERVEALRPQAPFPVDKRRALESQLLKEARRLQTQSASRPIAPRRPIWQRRSVFAVMSLTLVFLFLFSAVGVSAASVPGDVLYPIKRAAEQVRLTFTPDQDQAAVHLELAQARLHELDVLAQRGEVSAGLLADIEAETNIVLEHVASLPAEQQQALLTRMASFQDGELLVLGKVAALARDDKQTKVKAALADAEAKQQQVMKILAGSGGSLDDPSHNPGKGPLATAVGSETQTAPGNSQTAKPTTKPTATDRPTAEPKPTKEPKSQETGQPTKVHPPTPQKPTPHSEVTPPGQSNRPTPNSPPGQDSKPPKGPKPPKN